MLIRSFCLDANELKNQDLDSSAEIDNLISDSLNPSFAFVMFIFIRSFALMQNEPKNQDLKLFYATN